MPADREWGGLEDGSDPAGGPRFVDRTNLFNNPRWMLTFRATLT